MDIQDSQVEGDIQDSQVEEDIQDSQVEGDTPVEVELEDRHRLKII